MEEEISLWEIIETISKGKWIIITVTAVAIIIALALTFFFKPTPEYHAEASIRIENISRENFFLSSDSYKNLFISALFNPNYYNAEAFAELIQDPEFINEIHRKLSLDERGISPSHLSSHLEITVDSSNSALNISFIHSDPEFAISFVNKVLEELKSIISERNRERLDLLSARFELLFDLELKGLETLKNRLTEIRSGFEPFIIYSDSSHLTPEYAIFSEDIARIQSQIAELEMRREEIENLRVSPSSMILSIDDLIIYSPASAAIDVTMAPRLSLNMAIAAILGFTISIMAVIFIYLGKDITFKKSD